jgi:hypothetical protein
VTDRRSLLESMRTILLIDYPGRVVPETLARAGFDVRTHEGPGPMEYGSYVDAAGLLYVGEPSILDALEELRS